MGFAAHRKGPFLEAERLHQAIVKDSRPLKFRDAQIDMIDAEYLRRRGSAF
jgi:hypothetical protein